MLVKQAYDFLNQALKMTIGDEAISVQNEAGIVTMGSNQMLNENMNVYGKNIVNVIAKTVTASDHYEGAAPKIIRENSMFGAIVRMIFIELPEARENEAWELQDGVSVDPYVFRELNAKASYYSGLTTFEVDYSVTTKMIKQSFRNESEMIGFINGIKEAVANRMAKDMENFIHACFNNMIAETIFSDYQGAATSSKTGIKAVNVLKKYNDLYAENLPATEEALADPKYNAFIRDELNTYWSRLRQLSKLFNIAGYEGFTPADRRRVVYLDQFVRKFGTLFKKDAYNPEYTTIPAGDEVSYWQSPGKTWDWDSISKIHVKTSEGHTIEQGNILAVMYDDYALGIFNEIAEDATIYNPKGRYTNFFHSHEARYVNVPQRNFIVFFMA